HTEARAKASNSQQAGYISFYNACYSSDLGVEPDASSVEFTQPSGGKPSADAIAGRIGNTPTYSRNDNPLAEFINEMNSDSTAEPKLANPPAQPKRSEAEDKKSEKAAKPKAETQPADASSKQSTKTEAEPQRKSDGKTKEFNTGTFHAVRCDPGGDDAVKPAAKHAETEDDEPRGGRRRSDAHREGTVSVAELLEAAKKRQKDS